MRWHTSKPLIKTFNCCSYINLFYFSIGAPHDDDPNENCPGPYGFIMSGGNEDRRYFFQRCSDAKISSFV